MKNKQTAVEWLVSKLPQRMLNYLKEEIEQAKAMEKEQIIDAFGIGCHHESKRLVGYHHIAEQYYNETYRKEA
jgi:spore coat polysaccharide biosynthesis predicted glycosyltransferase SpsG